MSLAHAAFAGVRGARFHVRYDLLHITTDNSDFTDTMYYTSSQDVRFPAGVIELTFYIPINDDVAVEGNEVFQIRLCVPAPPAASLGTQQCYTSECPSSFPLLKPPVD